MTVDGWRRQQTAQIEIANGGVVRSGLTGSHASGAIGHVVLHKSAAYVHLVNIFAILASIGSPPVGIVVDERGEIIVTHATRNVADQIGAGQRCLPKELEAAIYDIR